MFSSIIASSVWCESDKTRLVWITMLAMADKTGVVEAAVPGLANAARVTIDDCKLAIEKFLAPDPDSRTSDNEGRRIEKIEGGWRLLNYAKYRAKLDAEERREYKTNWQRDARSKPKRKKKYVVADYESGERRFVAAESAGNQPLADQIAAEPSERIYEERKSET